MQVLTEGLEGYSVSEHERLQQREELQQSGRHRVESLVQQAADTALSRMKDRFTPLLLQSNCHTTSILCVCLPAHLAYTCVRKDMSALKYNPRQSEVMPLCTTIKKFSMRHRLC
jgi:hypothetical protein